MSQLKLKLIKMVRNVHHGIVHNQKQKNRKMHKWIFLVRNGLAYRCKFNEFLSLGFKMFINIHHGIAHQQKQKNVCFVCKWSSL